MTRAGGGTVRTTSRWISPNGTRSRRDSYCHAVSRSTSVRAFACDVAGRYGTLWKCTNTTRQPRFIIRHAATGESMPPDSNAATVPRRGTRRAARGRERDGGRVAVGGHRFAGGGVADDEARLPGGLRALPQRALPAGDVAGQGARPRRAAHGLAVRVPAPPRALRRDPARGRAGRAAPVARRGVPAAHGSHRRGAGPARRRPGARDGREPGAGG